MCFLTKPRSPYELKWELIPYDFKSLEEAVRAYNIALKAYNEALKRDEAFLASKLEDYHGSVGEQLVLPLVR